MRNEGFMRPIQPGRHADAKCKNSEKARKSWTYAQG